MKFKKLKPSFIALFFIFIMVFSTFAFTFLQSFRPIERQITLPEKNIIDYELTPEQESLLLQNGKTIAKFYYYSGCMECMDQLSFLEYIANQFSDQIILQEILSDKASLKITGYYGQRDLFNATQEEIFDTFCELMINPPVACIRRKV